MQRAVRGERLQRGRRRQFARALQAPRLLTAAGLAALFLLVLFCLDRAGGRERSATPVVVVARGEALTQEGFARERRYIRYRVAGKGRRYWYATIAQRFGVTGGWTSIAKATLNADGRQVSPEELKQAQHRLEVGQEVRIPFSNVP